MKRLPLLITLLLLSLPAPGAAETAHPVRVTRVAEEVRPLNAAGAAAPSCLWGNLNPFAYILDDYIQGHETYAYLFEAEPAVCSCPIGFTVGTIHLYLRMGLDDGPYEFDVSVGLVEAVWDGALSCWKPGADLCFSPVTTVVLPGAGLWDMEVAVPASTDCTCVQFGQRYAVAVRFPNSFGARPDLVTDNTPAGCVSWKHDGAGWRDMQDGALPGEIALYAEAVCCDDPTAAETHTFGGLKAMYR